MSLDPARAYATRERLWITLLPWLLGPVMLVGIASTRNVSEPGELGLLLLALSLPFVLMSLPYQTSGLARHPLALAMLLIAPSVAVISAAFALRAELTRWTPAGVVTIDVDSMVLVGGPILAACAVWSVAVVALVFTLFDRVRNRSWIGTPPK